MALGTPVVAATAYSAAGGGGTSVTPAYPTGIQTSDAVLLFVGQKPTTANGGTVTTPSGWTLRDSLTGAGGYGTATPTADTGNVNLFVYSWNSPVAGQTGNLTVTVGDNNVAWAFIVRIPSTRSALQTLLYGSADGQRTTTPTSPLSIALTNGTIATNLQSGDLAIWGMCIPTDVTTPGQFSAHTITATGATFGTVTELNEPDSGNGLDIGGFSAWASVTSGSSTVAPTIGATLAGTLTNVRGPVVLLRIRESAILVADTKTFNENLQPANLIHAARITADTTSVALTRNDANLTYTPGANNYTITAETVNFDLIERDANLLQGHRLVADSRFYDLIERDANLLQGHRLIAELYSDITLFTDNFDVGTANTPITGYTQQGDDNIVYTGTGRIKQSGNFRSVAYRPDINYSADQWAEITLSKLDNSYNSGVALRVQTSSAQPIEKTYHFTTKDSISTPGFVINVYDNSSAATVLASYSTTPIAGDRLRFEAVGNILSGYVNGKLILRVTDNIWSSGQAGIKGAGASWESDNFASGNYGGIHFDALPNNLKANRVLVAEAAAFDLIERDANLLQGHRLVADSRFYDLIERDANLLQGHRLVADSRFYDLIERDANLIHDAKLIAGGVVHRIDTETNLPAIFTDTFTQTNGTILGDTAEWDRWSTDNATQIVSDGTNAVISQQNREFAGIIVSNISFGPDQWAEQVHSTGSSTRLGAGPIVRGISGINPTGYVFRPGDVGLPSDRFYIFKYVNGVRTTIGDSGSQTVPDLTAGTYTSRLEIIGDRLYGYLNGKLLVTARDSSLPTGQPGFQIFYSGGTTQFSAGQIDSSSVNLIHAARLTGDTRSYTLTRNDANLLQGHRLIAETGGIRFETVNLANTFADNFNRADAANLGANWNITQGGFTITGNKVYGNISDRTLLAVPTATFSSDHSSKITASGDFNDYSDHVGVAVRLSNGSVADYRTWTELDPGSKISRSADTVTISGLDAISDNQITGMWYDGGTNWKTGDFWLSVGAINVTTGGDASRFIVAGITNDNTTGASSSNENRPSIQIRWVGTATNPRLELVQFRSSDNLTSSPVAIDSYQGSAIALNTPFYLEFERVGSTANCRIYSDSAHKVLVDTLSITLTEIIAARYYYVAGKSSTGSSSIINATIGPTNFDIPQTGYIFFGDGFLGGGRTLVRLSYGTYTSVGAPAISIKDGDNIELVAKGSRISLYINNVLKHSLIDTLNTTGGKPGILYIWSNIRDVFIDDFSASDLIDNTDIRVGRKLISENRNYDLVRVDAGLRAARRLTADQQTYTVIGQDVTLTKTSARILIAEPRVFSIVQNDTGLFAGRSIALAGFAFAFTGPPTGLTAIADSHNIIINPPAGWALHLVTDVSQAGNSACVYYGLSPAVSVGDQILYRTTTETNGNTVNISSTGIVSTTPSGSDTFKFRHWRPSTWSAELTFTVSAAATLTADTRSYTLTLRDANLLQGHRLTADTRSYTLTRNDANLIHAARITADTRSYILTRNDANLLVSRKLTAESYAPVQLWSDSFTGAEGVLGSNYTQQGDSNIRLDGLGNAYTISAGRAIAWPNTLTFSNNQYAEITLTQISYLTAASSGLALRVQTNESPGVEKSYIFRTGNQGEAYLFAEYSETSSFVLKITTTIIPKIGDRLKAVAIGNTLYFYVNNQLIAINSDISWPAGVPGIYGFNQQWKSDDFVAGNHGGITFAGTYTNTLANRKLTADTRSYTLTGIDLDFKSTGSLIANHADFTLTGNGVNLIHAASLTAEGFRANYLRNSMMVGTIPGTPGTAPTSWATAQSALWVTRTIVGTGVDSTTGLTYIDVAYSGTNNTGSISSLIFDPISGTTQLANNGETWTSSGYFGLLSGSWPSNANILNVFRNSSGVGVGNSSVSIKSISSSTLQRFTSTFTANNVATKYVQTAIRFDASNGETVNFSVRIAAPQLERGSVATAFIPTTNAVEYRWFETTFVSANLLQGHRLTADTRSYTLTRNDANLLQAHRLIADTRSYTLTRNDANLLQGYRLTADTRSYTLTRNDANLLQGHRLTADTRSYTLTLRDANLLENRRLVADTRSYTLTRNDANLLQGYRLTADTRSYTLTRNDANLLQGHRLTADARSYTLTRNDANLLQAHRLTAESRSYNLTGISANLITVGNLIANTGSYVLTGNSVNLLQGHRLTADTRSYTLTRNDANLLQKQILLAQHFRGNLIPNSQATGAVVGVIGSGGALPTGWSISSVVSGITIEVVAIGIMPGGNPYIDVKWSGTNSSGSMGQPNLYYVGNQVRADVNDKFTGSIYIKTIAGSRSGFQTAINTLSVTEIDSSSGYLTASSSGSIEDSRVSVSRTFNNSRVVFAKIFTTMAVPAGNSVDVTLRFSAPQLEPGLVATSYIPTTGVQVFRDYSVEGIAANLLQGHRLIADTRSYTLTRNDANLLQGHRLTAESRSYTLTRNDANVLAGRKLSAEEFRANYIRNSTFTNFVPGNPGVVSNWDYFTGTSNGITRQIIATGYENGLPYVDIKYSGTSTANPAYFEVKGRTDAYRNDKYTATMYLSLLAGSLPINKVYIQISDLTSSNVYLDGSTGGQLPITSILTKYTHSRTLQNINTKRVSGGLQFHVTLNETIDFTIRVAAPQFEKGLISTAFIPTTNAVQYRWFELSGKDTSVSFARRIIASVGYFDTNGYVDPGYVDPNYTTSDAQLLYGRVFTINGTSYILIGNNILLSRGGFIKVWNGSQWVSKPLRIWNGTQWVSKPLKIWTGSVWRIY